MIPDRFMSKVKEDPISGCWVWTSSYTGNGYAGYHHGGKNIKAHRYAYEIEIGKIPDGMDLDHLCRVRNCVNPYHMEPVTRQDNLLRGDTITARNAAATHCPHGHEYTPENTIIRRGGGRRCKTCKSEWDKRRYLKRKEADNDTD